MSLSTQEVEHIAKLARLRLTDQEVEKYCRQLSDILAYVEKMQSINTNDVEPTSQVTELINVVRDDKVDESGICDELVKSAPVHDEENIIVPEIIKK